MAEISDPVPPPTASRWVPRVLIAVLLAEGIWGLIVSLTHNLIVPFLAQQMGGDPQSPLYLGKGVYDFPALFVSILELCFAGIVAVALNVWVNRGPKALRVKVVKVRRVAVPAPTSGPLSITQAPPPAAARAVPPTPAAPPVPAPAPVASQPAPAPVVPPTPQPAPVAVAPPPAQPKPATAPAKPAKPQKPREVYYNIVGEPINPTEDD